MWNKGKKIPEEIENANSISVFAAGLKVDGDVEATNDIRIDGSILGNILANKKVLIGGSGKVKGDIHAREVYIMGEVMGDLQVYGLAKIGATAKVRGTIVSAEIQIEPGADVEGTLKKIGMENRSKLEGSLDKIQGFSPHLHKSS